MQLQAAETPGGVPVSPAVWRRLKSVLSRSENVFGCPWREAGGGWGRCGSHEEEAEWCPGFQGLQIFVFLTHLWTGGGGTEAKQWRGGGVQVVCGRGFKLRMHCYDDFTSLLCLKVKKLLKQRASYK